MSVSKTKFFCQSKNLLVVLLCRRVSFKINNLVLWHWFSKVIANYIQFALKTHALYNKNTKHSSSHCGHFYKLDLLTFCANALKTALTYWKFNKSIFSRYLVCRALFFANNHAIKLLAGIVRTLALIVCFEFVVSYHKIICTYFKVRANFSNVVFKNYGFKQDASKQIP